MPQLSDIDHVIALRQISVTAQFYLENKKKIHPPGVRVCQPKRRRSKHVCVRPQALWLLFLYVFSFPWEVPDVNWASQECCLFYPKSSDFPWFYFRGLFPSLSFESESEVAQSCPTLCDPVDCSLPGSSVHGILQARILEWVAISFSRGSSRPRDRTQVSHIAGRRFTL